MFFTFFKLYKCYQIAQDITYKNLFQTVAITSRRYLLVLFWKIAKLQALKYPWKTFLDEFVAINYDKCQALTNQLLSNVRSRTPVLQYLIVNVLSYQNICTCWWSRKSFTRFLISILFFWVSLSMFTVFIIWRSFPSWPF